MTPRLLTERQDCLAALMGGCLGLILQEDLYTNDGQMTVLRFAWDGIAAMPDATIRDLWITRIANGMYARNPGYHHDLYRAALEEGVERIRKQKGLPT